MRCGHFDIVQVSVLEVATSSSKGIPYSLRVVACSIPYIGLHRDKIVSKEKTHRSIRIGTNLSRFVLSLLIFIVVGYGAGLAIGPIVDKYDYPIHSWSWWSVRGIRDAVDNAKAERAPVPNTILLGSSLMVVAMAESDATWSKQRLDLTTYRKARYFDSLLSAQGPRPGAGSLPAQGSKHGSLSPTPVNAPNLKLGSLLQTINLASPGQLVSDAYLTLKEALNEGLKPRLVIYGIAPRDMIDSTMESALDTECYRYLSRLVPTSELEPLLSSSEVSSLSRKVSSALPLARRSLDIQLKCFETASSWRDKALKNGLAGEAMPLEKRMMLLSTYEPLDMVPGFIHAEVAQRADVDKVYRDNSKDYIARYRKPDFRFYNGQLQCLSNLIDLCEQNDIHLMVVNMPLRRCNVDLIDSQIYAKYIKDVSALVAAKGSTYADLCEFQSYSKQDYRDPVHLNGFGGMKFINRLANLISETRQNSLQAANVPRENP
ncbi:MAG: hypothetical protein SGJ27_13835 [Candidatus Melainabacteria bacterium]|nr:hypothetical protein [Candidatus Melainabacteria bacterium]